jgi:oligopeptide/dipeptide ABC transporter ATP-binding protein
MVELADSASLFATPRHPYTQALIAAVPIPDPDLERGRVRAPLLGEPPSPLDPPGGCAFHPRCAKASTRCAAERPVLEPTDAGGWVACHHWRI